MSDFNEFLDNPVNDHQMQIEEKSDNIELGCKIIECKKKLAQHSCSPFGDLYNGSDESAALTIQW